MAWGREREETGLEVGGESRLLLFSQDGPGDFILTACLPNPSRRVHTRKNKDRGHLLMDHHHHQYNEASTWQQGKKERHHRNHHTKQSIHRYNNREGSVNVPITSPQGKRTASGRPSRGYPWITGAYSTGWIEWHIALQLAMKQRSGRHSGNRTHCLCTFKLYTGTRARRGGGSWQSHFEMQHSKQGLRSIGGLQGRQDRRPKST